jgi:hypothetical protein
LTKVFFLPLFSRFDFLLFAIPVTQPSQLAAFARAEP